MSLQSTYQVFLQDVAQREVPAAGELSALTERSLNENVAWFSALSVLDHAAGQLPANRDEVFALYKKLFKEGLDFKASVYLIEEDYQFYLQTIFGLLEKLAVHFPEIYVQIAFHHREARRPYHNPEKMFAYLDKAIGLGVELAVAVKGYFLYYGALVEKDEAQAQQLLNSSDSAWNKIYKGYILQNEGKTDTLPALIEELKHNTDEQLKKSVLTFEAEYLSSTGDTAAAKSAYRHLIDQYDSDYAMFRLGLLEINETDTPEVRAEVAALWRNAFELGTVDAATSLAQHALAERQDNDPYDPALHWFSMGYQYNNNYCAYRLALFYLYTPELQDTGLGLFYLDEAVKGGVSDALVEKAMILLEGKLAPQNDQLAGQLMQAAAEKQVPYAIYQLGYFYETGTVITGTPDLEKALAQYEAAAQMDLPVAINNAGRVHRYGLLGTPDPEKARAWFERGVELQSAFSMIELAMMYEEDLPEKNFQRAFALFSQAAALDYPFALHAVGTYLENGFHNETPDPEAAFSYYLKGAELNDSNCLFEAGRCYRFGTGVAENPDQAIALYERAAALQHPKAMVELGLCYEHAYGVAFDAQRAFDYMHSAAMLGYYYGQYKLGYYYMHGLVERDTQKALEWLGKAADAGFAYALLELGDYYMYDYDGIDEPGKAFAYYQPAAEQDVVSEGIGLCYEFGIGVEDNMSEAFRYYGLAANNNYVGAMYHLGKCYLNGYGVKASDEEAFRWFYDAANRDNIAAQYQAGLLLIKGKGTPVNTEEGLELLNKAAAEGHAEAQFELGNIYLMGEVVEENEDSAMYWFEQAAAAGHEKAMKLTGNAKGR